MRPWVFKSPSTQLKRCFTSAASIDVGLLRAPAMGAPMKTKDLIDRMIQDGPNTLQACLKSSRKTLEGANLR